MINKPVVIVPAKNEEKNLMSLIEDVKNCCNDFDFVLIDDNSQDKTSEIAKHSGIFKEIIRSNVNLGYGGAIILGFEYALKKGYNFILTMDADGQHHPLYLNQIVKLLSDFKFVNTSRYHPLSKKLTDFPKDRAFVNQVITKMINEITNWGITDSFCGLRGYRYDILKDLNLSVKDYALPMEIWAKFVLMKIKLIEIPIDLIYRDPNKKMPIENELARLGYYLKVFGETLYYGF
jgi:dolichol-phosphate mannosyltransferase